MKEVYLTVLLTICMFLATGTERPQCFHFTWPGATARDIVCKSNDDKSKDEIKDNYPFTPCIDPIYPGSTKPNLYEIWMNNKSYVQPMESDVCIKYTYVYNKAVVNVSYFRGKITEDQTAITSGCYVQYIEGYIIEACACKSNSDSMPCNSTIRNTCSLLIIFVTAAVLLFM